MRQEAPYIHKKLVLDVGTNLLIAFHMHNTYKWILILLLLCGSLAGCQKELVDASNDIQLEPPPAPTDKLVIYAGPYMLDFMQQAKALYVNKFPDVELEFREFGEDSVQIRPGFYVTTPDTQENYEFTLTTELTAGRGPDLIVFEDEFDLYKVMQAGTFYNLDNFFAADASFDQQAYNQEVFNCGYLRGERLFVPLDYQIYFLLTSREALTDAGLPVVQRPTLDELRALLEQYIKTCDSARLKLFEIGASPLNWIAGCGLRLVDYSTKQVFTDTDAFRSMMEYCKILYPYRFQTDENERYIRALGDNAKAIRDRKLLFSSAYSNGFFYDYRGLKESDTPIYFPAPNVEGDKPVAMLGFKAAIRANSENQANAYEFLKILLSMQVQSIDTGFLSIPVLKEALEKNLLSRDAFVSFRAGDEADDVMIEALEQEEIDAFNALVSDVACPGYYSMELKHIFIQAMEPYFTDQKTYEACVEQLNQQLEIYLYE